MNVANVVSVMNVGNVVNVVKEVIDYNTNAGICLRLLLLKC